MSQNKFKDQINKTKTSQHQSTEIVIRLFIGNNKFDRQTQAFLKKGSGNYS